jgi:hypothetical protein
VKRSKVKEATIYIKEAEMTLAAPRSRQGRLLLVLAFLAATVAVVGTLMWASNAHANVGNSTTVTVSSIGASPVNVGDTLTYTVTIANSAACTGTCTNPTFEMQADPNLWPTAFGSGLGAWAAVACTIPGGVLFNDIVCKQNNGAPINDGSFNISYEVIATNDYLPGDQNGLGHIADPTNVLPSSFCKVYDDGDTSSGGNDCTYSGTQFEENDYVVTPATAENGPSQNHSIDFTIPKGFTCKSDIATVNDGTRSCAAGDVTITNTAPATATLVSANLSGTSMNSSGTETVVINSPTTGNVKVTLDLIFNAGQQYGDVQCGTAVTQACDAIEQVDPVALKTYGVVSNGSTAFLRHVDLPDLGTEDAANPALGQEQQPYCNDYLAGTQNPTIFDGVCGVLSGQDDVDDAQGSFHGACILGSLLTDAANHSDITWHIDAVPGPGPVAAGVSTFAGPNGEPCVMWSAATPGTQQIYAVYHQGLADQVTFWWDTNPNLPLIKEWNTIDSTRIVTTTGDLGDSPADRIIGNTDGAADWSQRDCSMVPLVPSDGGDCALANLDGLTLPIEASMLTGGNSGSFIRAAGRTFIDYTMGQHSDAGGAYTGPVDGARQTYAVSGDCGSVRLEDPTDGDVNYINVGDSRSVLSSDKGVAFEFVPNSNGALSTTLGNADCGTGATICVTISTEEDNIFHSPPGLSTSDETICVTFNVGPPTNKTPILAWAGQRVVLENYWGDPTLTNPIQGGGAGGVTAQGDQHHGACASNEEPNPGPVDSRAIRSHGSDTFGPDNRFGVQYSIQAGSGSFTGAPVGNTHDIDQTGHDAIVHVRTLPFDNAVGITDPNSNCTSRIIVESEDQTELDVIAYVVNDNDNVGNATPRSQQVAFVIYFMKFESETLQLIPDSNPPDNNGGGTDTWDSGSDPTSGPVTATVSDNVAAVVQVKGWVLTDNCPARDSKTATGNGDGETGEFFPANRCIFPDDWAFKAGAFSQLPVCSLSPTAENPIPQQCRPEFDIASTTDYSTLCPADPYIAGPFSQLDQITHAGLPIIPSGSSYEAEQCGDSLAPYPPATGGNSDANCLTPGLSYACRDSNFPDGVVNTVDAPMPPALVQFDLNGSGFLQGIDKATGNVDTGFASAAIPAEPWISQINADGEGYVWNTWGAGSHNGLYQYWTSLASHGPEVVSCAGPSSGAFVNANNPSTNPCSDLAPAPCADAPGIGVDCVGTDGYAMTEVYTDEHGYAMTLINGDANLDFSGCDSSAPVSGTTTPIVLLNGFYCPNGAAVGTSTLTAVVDYPDKRKHFAELTNSDTINWTWNGTKDVTVVNDPADSTGQFHYVVFHVTDRDGFCGESDSLHPVLGEQVDFRIDSTTGIILADINGNSAEGPVHSVSADLKSAVTHTFDTNTQADVTPVPGGWTVEPVMVSGECQAWIHVSESQLKPVNVVVTAYDPEGTVTFDTQEINPTPTPTPVPTAPPPTPTEEPTLAPTPTPFILHLKWGDTDCSGDVAPRDAQAILKRILEQPELSVNQPCPGMGQQIMIGGTTYHWADWDCTGGITPRDAQSDLKNVLQQTALSQTEPCPDVGSSVDVQVVSLP